MFFPKAVFCRVFQAAFRMALPVLPYRQPPLREAPASLPEIIRKNPLPRSGNGAGRRHNLPLLVSRRHVIHDFLKLDEKNGGVSLPEVVAVLGDATKIRDGPADEVRA